MLGENTQRLPRPLPPRARRLKAHNWYDYNTLINQTFGFPITGATYYPAALTTFATPYGSQFTAYNGNTMNANINSAHSGGAVVAFF